MVRKNIEKYPCSSCGKEKTLDNYYASSSPIYKYTGRLSVCKECLWELVSIGKSKDGYDVQQVRAVLRMIDRPFIDFLWESSIEESSQSMKDAFKVYMKNLGMKQYRDLGWKDSNHFTNNQDLDELNDYIPDRDVIQYWGRGYENWEYEFLENEKFKLMSSFECPDYGMEMIMKDICIINLEIEKIRQEKKDSANKIITNLIKTRSDLMNDANMKPIQSTGADASDQITFGTLIKKWENERPIPKPMDDEMKKYIDTFMVGHLAKMEGLHNEFTELYDREISKYTIDFNELNNDADDLDE